MTTLILWGDSKAPPPGLATRDVEIVAVDEASLARLRRAGLKAALLRECLGPDGVDRVERTACEWTRSFGSRPLLDGKGLRDLARWDGRSLWWWIELYLFHSTRAIQHVRTIEAYRCLLEQTDPDEVEAFGLGDEERLLLARTCLTSGVLFSGDTPSAGFRPFAREIARSFEARWNTLKSWLTTVKASLAGRVALRQRREGARRVAFVSHAAFWRRGLDPVTGEERLYEHYFDRLIPEVDQAEDLEAVTLAVGPAHSHRTRGFVGRLAEWLRLAPGDGPYVHVNRFSDFGVLARYREAMGSMRRLWRQLRGLPSVREAFAHAGVRFDDLVPADLAGMLLLQAPWGVRSYEEIRRALETATPDLVCLYAEDSGWGRATEAACEALGIPVLAVQHGILYPHYYSYTHGPDDAACPRPTRTAVFGEAARRFLVHEGRYAADSLVVTGSPKFDALLESAERLDRDVLRRELGVGPGETLLVVASRYRGIRVSFQSIASALPQLVTAVEGLDDVILLIKPHPAEPSAPYEERIREAGALRSRVLPPKSDLVRLLCAADALVTVESLAAVEALVLGRPVVILNMPTNQRQLVERGVALGVPAGGDPGPALASLRDPSILEGLAAARERYLPEVAYGLDGRSTERILALVRETAGTRLRGTLAP